MPVIPDIQEAKVGELWSEASLGKSRRLQLKNKLASKKISGMAQVIES
jgi:hypothetical protein